MPTDDDRFDDERLGESAPLDDRDGVIRRAAEKTSTVGMLMIVASAVMFLSSFGGLYLVFGSGEDLNVRVLEWFKGMNKDPKFQAEMQKQIDERNNLDPKIKMGEKAFNGATAAVGLVANTLVLLAGISMRALKGYALCIAGAVASLTCNGCCCVGIPIGIWALIVLVNTDVKAGFTAMKQRSTL